MIQLFCGNFPVRCYISPAIDTMIIITQQLVKCSSWKKSKSQSSFQLKILHIGYFCHGGLLRPVVDSYYVCMPRLLGCSTSSGATLFQVVLFSIVIIFMILQVVSMSHSGFSWNRSIFVVLNDWSVCIPGSLLYNMCFCISILIFAQSALCVAILSSIIVLYFQHTFSCFKQADKVLACILVILMLYCINRTIIIIIIIITSSFGL